MTGRPQDTQPVDDSNPEVWAAEQISWVCRTWRGVFNDVSDIGMTTKDIPAFDIVISGISFRVLVMSRD